MRSGPWNYRSWIFPRDPRFRERPGRSSTCTPGDGKGNRLNPAISSSAATKSPRSRRKAPAPQLGAGVQTPAAARARVRADGRTLLFRGLGVRRARIFDRCAPADGIEPFDQLAEQFMSVEPYSKAQRCRDRRQRFRASRQPVDPAAAGRLEEPHSRPHTGACQLAQPGRGLLLDRPAQGFSPTTSTTSRSLNRRCWRSASATSRSHSRLSERWNDGLDLAPPPSDRDWTVRVFSSTDWRSQKGWVPEWSCWRRSAGIMVGRDCRSGRWHGVMGCIGGRSGRRWSRRCRRRESVRRAAGAGVGGVSGADRWVAGR